MRRCGILCCLLLFALLAGSPTGVGAGSPVLAAAACGPNPSPPRGTPTIEVDTPTAGQRVGSPITVRGRASAFEATFGLALYDQQGAELVRMSAQSAAGQQLAPYTATVAYRLASEQDGCLWVYNVSPRDGSRYDIVQVPLRLAASGPGLPASGAGGMATQRGAGGWVAVGGLLTALVLLGGARCGRRVA